MAITYVNKGTLFKTFYYTGQYLLVVFWCRFFLGHVVCNQLHSSCNTVVKNRTGFPFQHSWSFSMLQITKLERELQQKHHDIEEKHIEIIELEQALHQRQQMLQQSTGRITELEEREGHLTQQVKQMVKRDRWLQRTHDFDLALQGCKFSCFCRNSYFHEVKIPAFLFIFSLFWRLLAQIHALF